MNKDEQIEALKTFLARAEAALARAYMAGVDDAAEVCNACGIHEQNNFGLGRATQNYYRARDAIRALPVPADLEERVEGEP